MDGAGQQYVTERRTSIAVLDRRRVGGQGAGHRDPGRGNPERLHRQAARHRGDPGHAGGDDRARGPGVPGDYRDRRGRGASLAPTAGPTGYARPRNRETSGVGAASRVGGPGR